MGFSGASLPQGLRRAVLRITKRPEAACPRRTTEIPVLTRRKDTCPDHMPCASFP